METHFWRAGAAAFALMLAGIAHALPTATLSFSEPTGVVGATDLIEVLMDFTLPAGGDGLTIDNTIGAPFGLDPGDLPAVGFVGSESVAFTEYDRVDLTVSFGCSGTFTTSCITGPPYNFTFGSGFNPYRTADGGFSFAAGTTTQIQLGTFTPSAGPVAAGTYTFYRGGVALFVYGKGVDASGTTVDLFSVAFPYQTCADGDASCAFTRTVTAVPEPQTLLLMAVGLACVGWQARRRHATRKANA